MILLFLPIVPNNLLRLAGGWLLVSTEEDHFCCASDVHHALFAFFFVFFLSLFLLFLSITVVNVFITVAF